MKNLRIITILLSILAISQAARPSTYQETVTEGQFTLKHGPDTEDNNIAWFEFSHSNNQGWIAIGSGTLDRMANMDIWKFIFSSSIQAIDQNVMGYAAPSNDSQNDINIDDGESSFDAGTGAWKVVFSRNMNTGDEQDAALVCGSNTLSLGIGSDHNNSRHSTTPVNVNINLGSGYNGCDSGSSGEGQQEDGEQEQSTGGDSGSGSQGGDGEVSENNVDVGTMPSEFSETVTNGDYTLKHGPDTGDNSIVWFEFSHTGNQGWIAIGAGQLAGMANMDIWKFLIQDGSIQAIDENVMGYAAPSADSSNDLNIDSSSSSFDSETGAWKVVFSRKISTGDEMDVDLKCGENTLSLAKGNDQNNSKHQASPVSVKINIGKNYYGCENYEENIMDDNNNNQSSNDDQKSGSSSGMVLNSFVQVVGTICTLFIFQ